MHQKPFYDANCSEMKNRLLQAKIRCNSLFAVQLFLQLCNEVVRYCLAGSLSIMGKAMVFSGNQLQLAVEVNPVITLAVSVGNDDIPGAMNHEGRPLVADSCFINWQSLSG